MSARAATGPSRRARLSLALVTGTTTLLLLAGSLGLATDAPAGVGDNGDGYRLFCSAGLAPDTPDRRAIWRGVVVTEFRTGAPRCEPTPSSAAVILAATVDDDAATWSLTRLGWAYAVLTAAGAAAAAVATSATSLRRAAVLALPLGPLVAVPWWSRFFVSTYTEPAGLLGTVWVLLGLAVVAVTRPERRGSRATALGLMVLGGVVAATAKPGFVPVGAAAAVACGLVVIRGRWRRLAGPVAACVLVGAAAAPVASGLRWHEDRYAAINTHNLVFTALLPELGPAATAPLGLPPAAYARSGEGFYVAAAAGIPGWWTAIGARPVQAGWKARVLLVEHPTAAARMIGNGLTATMRPALPYLPSAARGTAPEHDELRTVYPEAGPFTPLLLDYLDRVALPWLPAAVVGLALAAGAASTVGRWRRRPPLAAGLARLGAVAAGAGLGIVVVAVVADGYYELTKHVWLASYCLLVAAASTTAAALAVTGDRVGRHGLPVPAREAVRAHASRYGRERRLRSGAVDHRTGRPPGQAGSSTTTGIVRSV